MSWTTAAPVPSLALRKDMPPGPNPQPSSGAPLSPTSTTPAPPTILSSTGPKPLSLLSSPAFCTPRSRTPIAPAKLAKLANALGVSTPHPPSSPSPYPLRSPSTQSLPSFSTSTASSASTSSRHLLHIIPPIHLPSSSPEDDDDPDYRAQFRRGTLVAVHPTLQSQLGAIAREYALPSTGGMILYLFTDGPGPRITDEAWKMLWLRAVRADRESTVAAGLSVSGESNYSSRSCTPALITNGYPSPASPAESLKKLSRRRSECESSYDSRSLSSPSPSIGAASVNGLGMGGSIGDLPATGFNFTNASVLPILAKVEFDIDKRKAPWYEPWRQRRRQRAASTASTSSAAVSARELILGHGRRKSGGLEEVKRRLVGTTHIPPPAMAHQMEIQQPKAQAAFVMQIDQDGESDYEDEEPGPGGSPSGYLQLPDVEEEEGQFKASPLTGRALRRESTIPLDFEIDVPKDNGAPEDADPSITHVSIAQKQEEEQEEESDHEGEAVVLDGEQLLEEGKDPLAGVFPSDEQTWAQMANDEFPSSDGRHTPEQFIIPDFSFGGLMVPPPPAHQGEALDSGISDCDDDDPEDVISLWKAKNEPKLDAQGQTLPAHPPANLDKSLPPSPTEPHQLPQKGHTARHVPPPLVLTPSISPQVIIAPPSAGLEPTRGRSYLAYLDEKKDTDSESPDLAPTQSQTSRPPLPGIEAIEILVNAPSGTVLLQDEDGDDELGSRGGRSAFTDNSSSEGHDHERARLRAGSLVGNEEFRSRALDELEKEIVAVSPKMWKDNGDFEGNTFTSSQGTAQTPGTVEIPTSAKALPPPPPEVTREGDETRHRKANNTIPLTPQPSRWSTSSSSDDKALSRVTPPASPIKNKSSPTSPSAEGTSESEHQRIMQTPPPINSPEAGSSGLDLSPDPFGRRPHRLGSEGPEGDVDNIETFSSPSAFPRPPPARQSTSSSAASVVSPPHGDAPYHTMTSRFSQDSTTEEDSGKSKRTSRERTNSIISLKGVRNLLRRSGGGITTTNTVVVKHNGLPLMSPGLNGHTTPQTRFNEEVPPVPSMGFFHHGSGVMPTLPSSSQAPTREKHHRADSGLDPFHFDQDSRYPVRSNPSSFSGYISDLVPLASSPAVAFFPPPTPTTPSGSSMKTKGILKAWASRPKRAESSATIGSLFSSPIEPSASSQGKDSTSKKRPSNLDTSVMAHNLSRTEFTPTPHTATPRELVGLGIAEKRSSPTPLLQSPVFSERRESMDTTTRLSDFEIVSPAPPGRPRRGTENKI